MFTPNPHPRYRPLLLLAATIGLLPPLHAQIATDGTLGAAGFLNGPHYDIGAQLGRQVGKNLFHSFAQFDLFAGESANFSGPGNIQNIISRVTGGNYSILDGHINSSIAGANFFFINPSGVVMGPNAHVNVGGAFTVSTADALKLGDGGIFHANPQMPSVLTSAPPSAFGFLSNNPGFIEGIGTQIQRTDGGAISLVGGDISLRDGANFSSNGGALNFMSVGGPGDVPIGGTLAKPRLNMDGVFKGGNLEISGGTRIVATESGTISLQGENVLIEGGNTLISHGNDTPGAIGLVDIQARNSLVVANDALIQSNALGEGQGAPISLLAEQILVTTGGVILTVAQGNQNGGEIGIETGALKVERAGQILTLAAGTQKGGAITIYADSIRIDGSQTSNPASNPTLIGAIAETGQGGNLTIETGDLTLLRGGLTTSVVSSGTARGGQINILADTVLVDGQDFQNQGIVANAGGTGTAGGIDLQTRNLKIQNQGTISSNLYESASGGGVRILADTILVTGVQHSSQIAADVLGDQNGASLTITANEITLQGNAVVSSGTGGTGNAGNMEIHAKKIVLDGQNRLDVANGFSSESQAPKGGDAGKITIQTDSLQVLNGANIASTSYGAGRGGDLTVKAKQIVVRSLEQTSGIVTFAIDTTPQAGSAGNISIETDALEMTGRAGISASTLGPGRGGDISVRAKNITMRGTAPDLSYSISSLSRAENGGDAGNITIETDSLDIGAGMFIGTTTEGRGKSGDVTLKARDIKITGDGLPFETMHRTGIFADSATEKAGAGNAGNISIQTESLSIAKNGQIRTSSAGEGQGGNITISGRDVQIDGNNSGVFSESGGLSTNAGNGGQITLKARNLSLVNGSQISTSTAGSGIGGKINIESEAIRIQDGSSIGALTLATGDGGEVNIKTNTLDVIGGKENAGISTDSLAIDLSQPQNSARRSVTATRDGQAGKINIQAQAIRLDNDGFISSTSRGTGNSGQITINTDDLSVRNSVIQARATGEADAGSVLINATGSVALDGGIISTNSRLQNGGDVDLKIGGLLSLRNGSDVAAEAGQNGGNIFLEIGGGIFLQKSFIEANALDSGGNITARPRAGAILPYIVLDRSGVLAASTNANGGKIQLRSRVFLQSVNSLVDASSLRGSAFGGLVQIESPNTNLGGSLLSLPSNLLGAENQLGARCEVRGTGANSSFTVDPQNGVPTQPGELLPAPLAP